MEAHEALIAGVLGIASLYAWQRRRDPADRWLALVSLWICVTGIAGILLAQLEDPARYFRLALRLTGPPLLLLVCEEAVRTHTSLRRGDQGQANPVTFSSSIRVRATSIGFAFSIWLAAVIAMVIYRGGTLGGTNVVVAGVTFGVTAWMAILAVCLLASILTVLPAAMSLRNPGFPGVAAVLLIASESWAAIDPQWGTGNFDVGAVISYRSLLTFVLALIAILKAHQLSWTFLLSAAALDPVKQPDAKPSRTPRRAKKSSERSSRDKEEPEQEGSDEEEPATKKQPSESSKPAGTGKPRKKSRSKGKKKKKR